MSRPLAVYRRLMRTVNTVFKGDEFATASARQEIRIRFADARGVGGQEQDRLLAEGVEAADFLKTSVVQAKLNERGNYEMTVEKHHVGATAEEGELRPPKPSV